MSVLTSTLPFIPAEIWNIVFDTLDFSAKVAVVGINKAFRDQYQSYISDIGRLTEDIKGLQEHYRDKHGSRKFSTEHFLCGKLLPQSNGYAQIAIKCVDQFCKFCADEDELHFLEFKMAVMANEENCFLPKDIIKNATELYELTPGLSEKEIFKRVACKSNYHFILWPLLAPKQSNMTIARHIALKQQGYSAIDVIDQTEYHTPIRHLDIELLMDIPSSAELQLRIAVAVANTHFLKAAQAEQQTKQKAIAKKSSSKPTSCLVS